MRRRLALGGVALVLVFAAAQLIRPARTNPQTDPAHTLRAHAGSTAQLADVFDRSCRDCHSNDTEWRWYSRVAPASWLMVQGVAEGRKVMNFSEWGTYPPSAQRALLAASCDDARQGRMPGPYTWLRPETRLSAQDIDVICAAARKGGEP